MLTRSKTAIVCLALGGLASPSVRADPSRRLEVLSSSDCPAADEVARLLRTLLVDITVTSNTDVSSQKGEVARIDDLGDFIRVHIGEQERLFEDRFADCRERARRAALFIGLALAPPLAVEPTAPDPAEASDAEEPEVLPASKLPARHLGIELGPSAQVALGSGSTRLPVAGGVAGRVLWYRMPVLSFGAAVFLPTTFRFDLADARVTRVPLDASVRLSTALSRMHMSAELGPSFALLFTTGQRIENPQTELRPELGVRAALAGTWILSRQFGTFAALQATFVPRPSALEARPHQTVGALPTWWFGGALGLTFSASD